MLFPTRQNTSAAGMLAGSSRCPGAITGAVSPTFETSRRLMAAMKAAATSAS
ncbi:MAG: hypothetical protein ACLUEQ_08845 [Cloacibacillus evryensis]